MSAAEDLVYDYVIAGGGTAGCVLASRLSTSASQPSVALIEAGPDAHDDPLVQSPLGGPRLHNTKLEWNWQSEPQKGLDGRVIYQTGGKLLSGSSAVNYGMWTRGHAKDYDDWSQSAGDGKWGYEQLLPCFRRTETHFGTNESDEAHGFSGPVHTMQAAEYPLRQTLAKAFKEAGINHTADANGGDPSGVAYVTSNWHNFARQPAGHVYDLSKVKLYTDLTASKIIFEQEGQQPVAAGALLSDGKKIKARKEVIVSCGSIRTPQLLMLSGIGPKSQLQTHGIDTLIDNPAVGQNLHDHASSMMMWTLKDPSKGLAIGSPSFPPPRVGPMEFVYTSTVPTAALSAALTADGNSPTHRHVQAPSAHYEMTFPYGPVGANFIAGLAPPMDGSIITTGVGVLVPTARGSVTLKSADPDDAPSIDPNYLGTEHDRCILREATRQAMRVMTTDAAGTEVAGLWKSPDVPEIGLDSADEQLDAYLRRRCITWFHPGGTAAMGTVVDSSCRVKGVSSLRVVDASILPDPLTAHYQAPIYAIAERAAELILEGA